MEYGAVGSRVNVKDLQCQLVGPCLSVRMFDCGHVTGKAVIKIPAVVDTTSVVGAIASGHLGAVQQDDAHGYAAI